MLEERVALNRVSAGSVARGKTSNGQRPQKAPFDSLRAQVGLPAPIAGDVPRQVAAPDGRPGPGRGER
jgi:hypothetical protein